jgi:hypothetical protein
MHYLLGAIVLIILFLAVPTLYLALMATFLVLSAVIVKVSASIVTKSEPPLSTCIKAVIYSFIFALIAGLVSLKLLATTPLVAIIVVPLIIVVSKVIAYSSALEITLGYGVAVSVVVTLLGWLLTKIFGVSMFLGALAFT